MRFSKKSVFYSIALCLVIASCDVFGPRLEEKSFSPKNPTSYVFNIGKDELEMAITRAFEYKYQRNINAFPLKNHRDRKIILYIRDVFYDSKNNKNIHIEVPYFWVSDVYYYEGSPTVTIGDYLLVIEGIDTKKTKIDVSVIKLKAKAGSHFDVRKGGAATIKDVKGTTIEEYLIIQHIAEYLHIPIPPVNRPDIME